MRPVKRWLIAIAVLLVALLATGVRRDLAPEELAEYESEASRFVPVRGLSVHLREEGKAVGDGAPLVLLHGTASSLHTWDGWVAELERDHRLVRLDLPGFGLTGPDPQGRYAPEDDVALLVELFDRLGLDKVSLAGNSLGGGIVLRFALAHPERVEKLVLVDSSGLPHPPIGPLDLMAVPGVALLARWITPRAGIRRMMGEVYGDPSRFSDELVTRYHRLIRHRGNRAALADRRRAARPPLGELLGEIRAPTLILWGQCDGWIPLANGCEMHEKIAGSELIVYRGLGHVPMEEAPERTSRDVREFLGRSGPPDPARLRAAAAWCGEPEECEV